MDHQTRAMKARRPPLDMHEEKCRQRLHSKLEELKEKELIKASILPGTNEFEVLEFFGDACLSQTISTFIMTTRRFMSPHLMTQLRISCIRNSNLALVFDVLRIESLLRKPPEKLEQKEKADIVEAILGELTEADTESAFLNELTAFIGYLGDKAYFQRDFLATTLKSPISPPSGAPSNDAPTTMLNQQRGAFDKVHQKMVPSAATSNNQQPKSEGTVRTRSSKRRKNERWKKSSDLKVEIEKYPNGSVHSKMARPLISTPPTVHNDPLKNVAWIDNMTSTPIAIVRPIVAGGGAAIRKILEYYQ